MRRVLWEYSIIVARRDVFNMDVHFVDRDGRRKPFNFEWLQDVLGDRCQSDLQISDEETESAVNVPRLLDDEGDIPSEIPPGNHNSDSDSDQNMTLTGLQHRNQDNLPPPTNSCHLEMPNSHQAQKRPRIWKAITYILMWSIIFLLNLYL
ncbi:unnamed protein product [Parnassius apollo]|uniref:(apollo) hypothetical protein n=1 Tax=Parnassius apollo TaxID=110799 RepID=A0A8S3WJJ5_PARAO|nr:unnamed protein product [Parnassius apollo]